MDRQANSSYHDIGYSVHDLLLLSLEFRSNGYKWDNVLGIGYFKRANEPKKILS
jgi:hypothetical protein